MSLPEVNLVVNYNLPTKYDTGEPDYEVYLHRVEELAGLVVKVSVGAVFNLLLDDRREIEVMEKIERYFEAQVKEIKSWELRGRVQERTQGSWPAGMSEETHG
ncbi:DEAD-box ATP-dependent RNA helicase 38 [Raphanus sativus]|nr:DEAD-box ATP-dependent RNA helicase 38 [Raphanus sativus]